MTDTVMAIARSGLEVERQRVELIAANLANAGSPLRPDGSGFKPMTLVSAPRSGVGFSTLLDPSATAPDRAPPPAAMGVQVQSVDTIATAPRLVHDPVHPYANEDGNVAYPSVDQAQQMSLLVQAQRAYEANVVMANAARAMATKALEIGGSK